MLYTDFEVGGKALRLRLTSRSCVELEKKLGRNPVAVFLDVNSGRLPTLSDVLAILHACLQPLEHGYTEAAVNALYDEYVDEGHNLFDLVPVIMEVFKTSGLLPDAGEGENTDPNGKAGK